MSLTLMPSPEFELFQSWIRAERVTTKRHNGEIVTFDPSQSEKKIGSFSYAFSDVDSAVQYATDRLRAPLQVESIVTSLEQLVARLNTYRERLISALVYESGRPLAEAEEEITKSIQQIEVLKDQEHWPEKIRSSRRFGVTVLITPFSFSAALPLHLLVENILAGNPVIWKPSEKTPWVSQLVAEILISIGDWGTRFQMLYGEKEMGRRLALHSEVSLVLFVGSYEVGARLRQETLVQPYKKVYLWMSARNGAIFLPGTEVSTWVERVVQWAFFDAGQGCSGLARIFVPEAQYPEWLESVHRMSKEWMVGAADKTTGMGPLIDATAVDRYVKFLGVGVREGFQAVMRGKALDFKPKGCFVAPSIFGLEKPTREVLERSVFFQSELSAPVLTIVPYRETQEAIDWMNLSQFALQAGVFGEKNQAHEIAQKLEVPQVDVNQWETLPFFRGDWMGLKKSGSGHAIGKAAHSTLTWRQQRF